MIKRALDSAIQWRFGAARVECVVSEIAGVQEKHPLYLARVGFDHSQFDPSWFAIAGIDCPAQISASRLPRQAEFFAGRLAAHTALKAFNQVPVSIPINPDRTPAFPPGFCGSISHSGEQAVALVACSNPSVLRPGIDIQTIVTIEQSADIQPLVATEGELAIMTAAGLSREMAVTAIFSAKEALYKALFPLVGDVLEFDVVTLIQHNDSLLHFEAGPSLRAYGIRPHLHCHLEIQDQHVQCVTWQA